MNKYLSNLFFPPMSKWIDIGCYEVGGNYYLLQMRYRIDNNKKYFRRSKMGFINDYRIKEALYEKVLSINTQS